MNSRSPSLTTNTLLVLWYYHRAWVTCALTEGSYPMTEVKLLKHASARKIFPLGLPRKCDAQLIEYCKSPTPLPVHRPDDHISVLPSFVYSIGEYSQSLALFGAITVGLVKYCLFASRRGNL